MQILMIICLPIILVVSCDHLPPVNTAAGSNHTDIASETDDFDYPSSLETDEICAHNDAKSVLDQAHANPEENSPASLGFQCKMPLQSNKCGILCY
jgi:hypothetical protein